MGIVPFSRVEAVCLHAYASLATHLIPKDYEAPALAALDHIAYALAARGPYGGKPRTPVINLSAEEAAALWLAGTRGWERTAGRVPWTDRAALERAVNRCANYVMTGGERET